MKIYAQQGYGPKDKLTRGLADGVIDAVILSPRYLKPEKMQEHIEALNGRAMMDPELYAARYLSHPSSNLGNLESWDYFRMPRRSALISGVAIPSVIQDSLNAQKSLGLQQWIAPNVYIESADSIETAIALNFINKTKESALKCGDQPVFATLALSRDAVMSQTDFQDIFDSITAVDLPPDGYYIIMGSQSSPGGEVRSDIYNPQVIAGWMYMNYVLSINGARVINGYCHLLSPLLACCGAESAASGWFSGLRQFCITRYVKEPGRGRSPVVRYVSCSLLARVKHSDYLAFKATLPAVSNGLELDVKYDNDEPSRTEESLQSWEALLSLSTGYSSNDVNINLTKFEAHIQRALELWTKLQSAGFSQDVEANKEKLKAMQEAIAIFREWAEIA